MGIKFLAWIVMAMLSTFSWQATAAAHTAAPAQLYSLDDTESRRLPSKILQRDYEVYVSLPQSYSQTKRDYPVMFVTDANYAFPLIRSIARRVGDSGKSLEEFILVGLSYSKGDSPHFSRKRDYTPTDTTTKIYDDQLSGQAEPYRQFIAREVFPFIAKNYRADMSRKIYAGHSYGALFGVHVLLTEPQMFNHYILGSPSLWYDKRAVFNMERHYAATHKDMPAKVFMLIGGFETVKPRHPNPRYHNEIDMVKDLHAFERQLKSHKYPTLSIQSRVIDDEDHQSVFPSLITRGLRWALPARQ